MKTYEVQKQSGQVVSVDAATEFSAVAKAHKLITGEKAAASHVTWHGVYAECRGHRYNRPAVTWQGR